MLLEETQTSVALPTQEETRTFVGADVAGRDASPAALPPSEEMPPGVCVKRQLRGACVLLDFYSSSMRWRERRALMMDW